MYTTQDAQRHTQHSKTRQLDSAYKHVAYGCAWPVFSPGLNIQVVQAHTLAKI